MKNEYAIKQHLFENGSVSKAKCVKSETVNKYGVKVGDVFYTSFRYDKPIWGFFQVVSVTEYLCRIVEIDAEYVGGSILRPQCKVTLEKQHEPKLKSYWVQNQIHGDLKRIQVIDGLVNINIGDYKALLYDGRIVQNHWD